MPVMSVCSWNMISFVYGYSCCRLFYCDLIVILLWSNPPHPSGSGFRIVEVSGSVMVRGYIYIHVRRDCWFARSDWTKGTPKYTHYVFYVLSSRNPAETLPCGIHSSLTIPQTVCQCAECGTFFALSISEPVFFPQPKFSSAPPPLGSTTTTRSPLNHRSIDSNCIGIECVHSFSEWLRKPNPPGARLCCPKTSQTGCSRRSSRALLRWRGHLISWGFWPTMTLLR